MKLALQYEMQRPSLDDHKVLTETMEQCILADEVGFDYLWFVEHHFLTGFSASPAPDLVFAALSQRTKRIRLGLGVVILHTITPIGWLSESRCWIISQRAVSISAQGGRPLMSLPAWELTLVTVGICGKSLLA